MTLNRAMLSSASAEWFTPTEVLDRVRRIDRIGLDPCWAVGCKVTAKERYRLDKGDDGLALPWFGHGLVFVNPPYSRALPHWIEKASAQSEIAEVIALVPARTDTKWFQFAWNASALCFWRGRLKFLGASSSAPFPSALVYWGHRRFAFAQAFEDAGRVVFP